MYFEEFFFWKESRLSTKMESRAKLLMLILASVHYIQIQNIYIVATEPFNHLKHILYD